MQAFPIYAMSCFLLPQLFCDDMHKLADFWWNSSHGERKIRWISWDKLCNLEYEVSVPLRFNLELLARQGCMLVTHPETLSSQLLKANFPQFSFFILLIILIPLSFGKVNVQLR